MHHRQIRPDHVLAQVIQLGVGQRRARQAELDDRHIGGAVAQDQGRRDVARHVLQHHQGTAGELRHRPADIGPFVQVDLLDADALIAGGFDARDVIDQGGQLPLVQGQDAVLHVLRVHAVVGPHHTHHRNVDLRKDVDGHAQRRPHPKQTEQDQR